MSDDSSNADRPRLSLRLKKDTQPPTPGSAGPQPPDKKPAPEPPAKAPPPAEPDAPSADPLLESLGLPPIEPEVAELPRPSIRLRLVKGPGEPANAPDEPPTAPPAPEAKVPPPAKAPPPVEIPPPAAAEAPSADGPAPRKYVDAPPPPRKRVDAPPPPRKAAEALPAEDPLPAKEQAAPPPRKYVDAPPPPGRAKKASPAPPPEAAPPTPPPEEADDDTPPQPRLGLKPRKPLGHSQFSSTEDLPEDIQVMARAGTPAAWPDGKRPETGDVDASGETPEAAPTEPAADATPQPAPPKRKRSPVGLILAGVAVLALAGGAYYFVMLRDTGPETASAPVSATPPNSSQPAGVMAKVGGVTALPQATATPPPIAPASTEGQDPQVAAFVKALPVSLVLARGDASRAVIGTVVYTQGDLIDPATGLRLAAVDPSRKVIQFTDDHGAHYERSY